MSWENIDSDGHDYYDVNYNKHYDDYSCYHRHDDGYADNGPALRADCDDGHEHLGDSVASSGGRPDAAVDRRRERPDPADRRAADSHLGPRRHRCFPPSISPERVRAQQKAVATALHCFQREAEPPQLLVTPSSAAVDG